jgi:HK97 family phage major capsid protein
MDKIENIDEKIAKVEQMLKDEKEIRSAKELESKKEKAFMDKPELENRKSSFAEVAEAMKEKRTVTLSGTGMVNTVRELVKLMTPKTEILNKVRYFYGANKNTVVPVWGTAASRPAPVAEGGTITASNGNLGAKTLVPVAYATSFKVSQETLDLSAVDFEAELQGILADAYADAIAYQIFNGNGSNGQFVGLANAASINEIHFAGETQTLADLANLALTLSDKTDAGVIFMKPTEYAKFVADTSDAHKVYREDLIRNKTIEGVPVFVTSYAPDGSSFAADFSNYAVAVAGELRITPKENAGELAVTYDADMYLAGAPVIEGNFYVLKAGA